MDSSKSDLYHVHVKYSVYARFFKITDKLVNHWLLTPFVLSVDEFGGTIESSRSHPKDLELVLKSQTFWLRHTFFSRADNKRCCFFMISVERVFVGSF